MDSLITCTGVTGDLDEALDRHHRGRVPPVIAAVLFTSMGIGFAISIASQIDSQAVQYGTVILLASLIFTGFTISLTLMHIPTDPCDV